MGAAPGVLDGVVAAPGRWAPWGRRAFLAVLLVFVLAGTGGLLGVRTSTAVARGGGYDLEVEFARVARAGLDVPLRVTVRHEGGFGKELTLAVTGDYFDIFETQGFTPDPSSATRDRDEVLLTFDGPPGDVFVVAYDAYVQPSSQMGRDASVTVVDDGVRPVAAHLSTWVLP